MCKKNLFIILSMGTIISIDIVAGQTLKTQAEQILEVTGVKGGLVVHIGCGDGKLTGALRLNESYLVHGLDMDPSNVEKAREYIRSLGIYGNVSIECWNKNYLPYVDNLVNLVVCENPGAIPEKEIMRVLRPNGVAYIKKDSKWIKIVKPWPKEIDEWTHYLYDASNNAVSHDQVVGPPRRLQWVGSPQWSRHHDHMASMSALVSSGGRIFYIFDEGPSFSIQMPPDWFLIARDAFNGVILWKRRMQDWNTHLWPLKSGPAQVPRRLVAIGDKVYVTLGLDAPVSCLDAVTGKTIRTYEETKNTEEIIFSDGVLFLMVNNEPSKWRGYYPEHTYVWDNTTRANKDWAWDEKPRWIMAVSADSGKVLWKKECKVVPLTLGADNKLVCFHDGEKVVCLSRKDGSELWSSKPVSKRSQVPVCFGPTLVIYKDVVLFAGGDKSMTALSAKNGEIMWTSSHPRSGHQSPQDLFVINELTWAGEIADSKDSGIFTGRDLYTGEVKSEFLPDINAYWFHHRCYRSKATDKYIMSSRTGIEFIDVNSKHWDTNHWVRGGCIYGIMPSNGMVYAPPHSCACYIESKLNGFNALAPESTPPLNPAPEEERLEKGPAYTEMQNPTSQSPDEWPTYRHDSARSGSIKPFTPSIKKSWETELGGKLTSLVVADRKVFIAKVDTHILYALDVDSGKILWTYTTGGRIDSPPTIYRGRVLFGCSDGWIYCLRSSDGKLAWRFLAAPQERRTVAFEQIESLWPVSGSVLVQDGILYCVAGRSMFLDGGMRLLRIEPETGRKISETILDERDPNTGKNLQVYIKGVNMPVALPDVLSSDGKYIYMRSQRFDTEGIRQNLAPEDVSKQTGDGAHLFSTIGFLDDSWFHRSYWLYGRCISNGYGGWFQAARFAPAGRILTFNENTIYGYGRMPEYYCNASVLEHHLFAADRNIKDEDITYVKKATGRMDKSSKKNVASASDWKLRQGFPMEDRTAANFRWTNEKPPLLVRAMVLASDVLFVAGPPDVADEQESYGNFKNAEIQEKLAQQKKVFEGQKGALLLAFSISNGVKLAEQKLKSLPVFDGLAAGSGRLYLATTDGKVLCVGGEYLSKVYDEVKKVASNPPVGTVTAAERKPPPKKKTQPVLIFSFDSGDAKDGSGNNNNGKIEGATSIDGKYGKAFYFDGKSQIKVEKSESLNPADSPLSVEVWVKAEKDNGVILARGGSSQGYALIVKDGKPQFMVRIKQEMHSVSSKENVLGKWVHLAGVLTEKQELKIYVDGKISESVKVPGFIAADPSEAMEIGADAGSTVGDYKAPFNFTGIIDEVKIYDGELTESEIKK